MGTSNRRNSPCDTWNVLDNKFCGFVGHDGIPWLWEASQSCWLPVTESSRAGQYAALQARHANR
jgi:hypothetical protein